MVNNPFNQAVDEDVRLLRYEFNKQNYSANFLNKYQIIKEAVDCTFK